MNRIRVELRIRGLRAQLGDALRRGAPVDAMLRGTIADLEAHARQSDPEFLKRSLRLLYRDFHFSLLLQAHPWLILSRDFFCQPAHVVAPDLLSKIIVTGDGRAGRIAEVVVGEDDRSSDLNGGIHTEDLAGRLALSGNTPEGCACILCVHDREISRIAITAIAPLGGVPVMEAQAGVPPDSDGKFRGSAVVKALGLLRRHQGNDVTRRQSAIRIASDLQAKPLVVGRPWRPRSGRPTGLWRWTVPHG